MEEPAEGFDSAPNIGLADFFYLNPAPIRLVEVSEQPVGVSAEGAPRFEARAGNKRLKRAAPGSTSRTIGQRLNMTFAVSKSSGDEVCS